MLKPRPTSITPNDAGVDACLNGWILTDRAKLFQFVAPIDEFPVEIRNACFQAMRHGKLVGVHEQLIG